MSTFAYHARVDVATAEDKTVIRNLMQIYQYDLREFSGEDFNSHGLFEYNCLDHCWTPAGREDGRLPSLIRVSGKPAGFALKNRWSYLGDERTEHAMAEFFIARKWRGKNVGQAAAHALFDRFPGQWEVGQERCSVVASACADWCCATCARSGRPARRTLPPGQAAP